LTEKNFTEDYRPGAVGGAAGGCGRSRDPVLVGDSASGFARRFNKAYSIFRTAMVSLTKETNSLSGMIFVSRARIRWYSSSEAELSAILRNLLNSFSLLCLLPSAIFAGIETAALKI
jgi:hypothetical protein